MKIALFEMERWECGTFRDLESGCDTTYVRAPLNVAGLDVLAEEPVIRDEVETLRAVYTEDHDLQSLLADHALLCLNNLIITPHNAFNTQEAVGRILDTTHRNLRAFLDGSPVNIVPGSD